MSAQGSHRLPAGGYIQRDRILDFHFDGIHLTGHPGDTLASALLAHGVRLVGRSFKYHRPRGILSAGAEEPNALVQLTGDEDEPNVRATMLPLSDGLKATSVNRWPSLRVDLAAVNGVLSPLFPVGFYYKTFMGGFGWDVYGRVIRRMAGLGTAPRRVPEHRYEKRFHHCDVLVVGAGPAGLSAALVAGRSGARVMLVDEAAQPGGQLLDRPLTIDAAPASEWLARASAELAALPNVVQLTNTAATGYYDHNFLTLLERFPTGGWLHERLWKVRAGQVILACGAMERPLVFPDNDRPGVMMLHAAVTYARRYGVMPGRRAVVVTNNSSAYAASADLASLGLDVAAIVDLRRGDALDEASALSDRISDRMIDKVIDRFPTLARTAVLRSHTLTAVEGHHSVRSVQIGAMGDVRNRARQHIDCDLLLMSGGWNPLVHLSSQTGAKPRYDEELACFVPGPAVQAERSAGAARGVFDTAECIADGAHASVCALSALGQNARATAAPGKTPGPSFHIEPVWRLAGSTGRKAFVDFQNDVTVDDIDLAVNENMVSVEHVKRYTTAGMGTDQGKLGNTNVIGVLANALAREPAEVGTTTYRPPYIPVPFGAITGNDVGELALPSRRTPVTDWNEARGASMFEAGGAYRRPSYYPGEGEDMAGAIAREARACRERVGMYDGSPLGKFELQGRDVVTFLERVYTNRWADLAIGQGRFGLMLREDGRLLDDGVTFRLGESRYWMFCGTGAADHVQMHLERLAQLEWPELDVHLIRVTSQWANVCVCGPKARDVLHAAGTDIDLSPSALPFMGLRLGLVAGLQARLARVGYTGELSFEVNVRASRGEALWQALLEAGEAYGITPIGSEASMVMRCEKGFISAGFESDGTVNPYDAGLAWVVDESKPDFIGKRSLLRDRNVAGIRSHVVGLLPNAHDFVPPDGSPLLAGRLSAGEPNVIGYVTQGCFSPNLQRAIALAVLDDGRARLGTQVTVAAMERQDEAEVVAPCFIDPKGTRMR